MSPFRSKPSKRRVIVLLLSNKVLAMIAGPVIGTAIRNKMMWAWLGERPTGFQQAIASFSTSRASALAEKKREY